MKKKLVSLISLFFLIVIASFTVYTLRRVNEAQIMEAVFYNGAYWCHGCSVSYDHAYARWKSSTADCTGIVGTPEYSASCGCSAPGKLLPDGFDPNICTWPGPYICSACADKRGFVEQQEAGENSWSPGGRPTGRGFVTWISTNPDCSGYIYNERLRQKPRYNIQDPYCNPFSAEFKPSPSAIPDTPYCTVTARNNPCPLYPGQIKCSVTVDWSYNVPDSRYEMHLTLIASPGMQQGEGRVHDDNYGRGGKHDGSVVLTKGWQETGLLEGKIDGVTKCQLTISFREVNHAFTYPDIPDPKCQRDANGKPVCKIDGSWCRNVNMNGISGCKNDEVLCEANIDACGCANRLACAKKSAGGCEARRDQFGALRKAADIYQRQCGGKKTNTK